MARWCFEVKTIEFREQERCFEYYFKNWFDHKFYEVAKRYVPKIKSRVKSSYFYRNKLIIEFKKTISLNTLNNILYSMNFENFKFENIEYNSKEKKVIVKVK